MADPRSPPVASTDDGFLSSTAETKESTCRIAQPSFSAAAPDDGIYTLRVDPESTSCSGLSGDEGPGPRKRPTAKRKAKTRNRRKAARASRRRNR